MASTNEPPTKKSRGESSASNDLSNAVQQCVQDMVRTVQERFRNRTPLFVAEEVKNSETDKTPTISNTATTTRGPSGQDTTVLRNVVIRNFPSELRALSSTTSSAATSRRTPSLKEDDLEMFFSMGYDSDGEIPDFKEIEKEKEDMDVYNETTVSETRPTASTSPINNEPEKASNGSNFIFICDNVIEKMLVDNLRKELKLRGLSTTGKKAILQERLKKAMQDKVELVPVETSERPSQPDLFAPDAFWTMLQPGVEPVEDPTVGTDYFSPTDKEGAKPKLFDYPDVFDRPPFINIVDVPVFDKFGRREKDEAGKPKVRKEQRQEGTPTQSFLDKHHLDRDSRPIQFFEAFCPMSLTDRWTTYTNHKAMLENAGQPGKLYPDFTPFTVKELRQHIGVRILHGLSPSPRVEMKFDNQAKDPVNGNDFVSNSLGPNATRRHKHFRRFFACQNPVTPPKPRKTNPMWKIEEFLCHVLKVSLTAWTCGEIISVDEQTVGFKGRHTDKLRITYKAEGDGFQCDALCSDGYTYTFYFRNVPAPPEYLEKGLSTLHSRVMWLFDQVKSKHHRCGMDNLYTSVKFFKEAYCHEKKVLCHGVARKSGRGVPTSVLQEEVMNRNAQLSVRGTVKAAKLVGDINCPEMCAVSVYDTKPVHFLTMCNRAIKWIKKKREVFNKGKNITEKIRFLRLNITDDYNNGMGQVDIADQLRNTYRFDHWLRNYKWWHSIFWWAFQVLMVNSYVVYKKVLNEAKVTPMSHYEYQKEIAMGWIDELKYGVDAGYKTPSDSESKSSRRADISTLSSVSSSSKERGFYLNSASLDPKKGKLRIRIDRAVPHWPSQVPPDKNRNRAPCQLCRWATDRKVRKRNQTAYCQECNVVLCLGECYRTFHTVWDVVGMKDDLCRRCNEE